MMNQLTIGTVSGLTQPIIDFPTEYQENSKDSGQQNFQKQIVSNGKRNQKSENLKESTRQSRLVETMCAVT